MRIWAKIQEGTVILLAVKAGIRTEKVGSLSDVGSAGSESTGMPGPVTWWLAFYTFLGRRNFLMKPLPNNLRRNPRHDHAFLGNAAGYDGARGDDNAVRYVRSGRNNAMCS